MNIKQLSEENRKIYETQLLNRTGFLQEGPGQNSSTRLMFVIGCLSVIAMAGYMCYKMNPIDPIQVGTFIVTGIAAFGGVKVFGTRNEGK